MLQRAYSLITIKSTDEDERTITGIATTPEPDRLGDIVEPKGAEFKLPLPLLWQHNSREPIGHVTHAKVTKDGIEIRAKFAKIDEPGKLKDRLDEAWQSVKSGLVQGLSIGFNSIESTRIDSTFSFRFIKWLWLELSVVTIPAHQSASITAVKSIDLPFLAAAGQAEASDLKAVPSTTPRDRGNVVVRSGTTGTPMKKSTADSIKEFEATRQAKAAERDAIMDTAGDQGLTLDAAQSEKYDALDAEVKSIDEHLKRLRTREEEQRGSALEIKAQSVAEGSAARAPQQQPQQHQVQVHAKQTLPPGVGFARAAICKMAAYMEHINPVELAKARYPSDDRLHVFLKSAVAAGTTVDSVWASPLVDQTNLAGEFLEFLRPQTIVGKFGMNGVPALRRLPFNVRIPVQTTGGSANWVGEGAPKGLTKFNFDAVTVPYTKIAAISVITKELARFSSPSADTIVRDQLAAAVVARMDIDFIDPAKAAVTGVNPASITNGLTALSSAGTSAENARTDVQNLLEGFILANLDPTSLVLIMPATLALALSIKVNSLGQREFPDLTMRGGSVLGIPVITSQYAANEATYGNLVIAVNAGDIGLADDGAVDISVSGEASLQMDDAPTNNSASPTATSVVSMFQTNSLAILAERFIHWKKLRSTAVVFMDDVNWGSIGSPV